VETLFQQPDSDLSYNKIASKNRLMQVRKQEISLKIEVFGRFGMENSGFYQACVR
jgi:hypothetical protein